MASARDSEGSLKCGSDDFCSPGKGMKSTILMVPGLDCLLRISKPPISPRHGAAWETSACSCSITFRLSRMRTGQPGYAHHIGETLSSFRDHPHSHAGRLRCLELLDVAFEDPDRGLPAVGDIDLDLLNSRRLLEDPPCQVEEIRHLQYPRS